MTPPPELAKCANCDCWFAAAATEEVFHHATKRCRSNHALAAQSVSRRAADVGLSARRR